MKILFLWKALVSAAYHKKLDELAKYDIELNVLVPENWGSMPIEIRESPNYSLIPMRVRMSGYNHFHWYPDLSRIVQNIKPDIFHIEEEHYSFVTFQAMRAAKKSGAKTLFVTWQNIYKQYPFPFSWIERYNINHANIAIAGSEEVKHVLKQKGYSGDIVVIPLGVDEIAFVKTDAAQLKSEIGLKSDNFVIGYMGRLIEEKGLGTLVDAFSKLNENARLLLVGGGPYKDKILAWANHPGIKGRVIMIDQVPSLDVPRYMNCMDCLVLPSLTKSNWKEQFGRVLIEAMACEVPVIGSNSGEIPTVIGDAGLIFQEGDSLDLLKQIELLAKDKVLRKTLGVRGRQRVLDNYTQKKIAEATYSVYKRIIAT